jgi:hypothetical protein
MANDALAHAGHVPMVVSAVAPHAAPLAGEGSAS